MKEKQKWVVIQSSKNPKPGKEFYKTYYFTDESEARRFANVLVGDDLFEISVTPFDGVMGKTQSEE